MNLAATLSWLALTTLAGSPSDTAAPATATEDTRPRAAAPAPLHLHEVLRAALEHHPMVRQAESAVDEKEAGRLTARGAYDPKLKGEAGLAPFGYYSQREAKVGVSQTLPVLGAPEVFGGWRAGSDWSSYDGKHVTGTLGELEAGLRVQLMNGLFIDPGRYGLRVAQIEQAQAEAKRELVKLKLTEAATEAYLSWVVTHQQLGIARDLVALAESRQDFLTRQVEAGALPRIALVDNQRQLLSRSEKVIDLERKAVASALKLGLYLRDDHGRPVRLSGGSAPALSTTLGRLHPPATEPEQFVERALSRRPELTVAHLGRGLLRADLELATNEALPQVQLELVASQDFGQPQSYGPGESRMATEAQGRLSMSWPVLFRKARGKMAKAQAQMRALDAEVTLLEDVVRQEVEVAHATLIAAYQRVKLVREALIAAHQLEEAERAKLLAGSSDLLSLNLREERAADSAEKLAEALADLQMAAVALQVRQGVLPDEDLLLLANYAPASATQDARRVKAAALRTDGEID